jgi:MFS family permease
MGPEVRRVVVGRTVRGFADGFVSVLLAQYLTDLGFSPFQVGLVVTGTLVGSAALTLAFGARAGRTGLEQLLVVACVLMAATGLGFTLVTAFVPLVAIAVVGTLNPTAGDVSVFLPTEQAFIADRVDGPQRTGAYATYNLCGVLAGAVGALASGLPTVVAEHTGWSVESTERLGFAVYALCGLGLLVLYRPLARDAAGPSPSVAAAAAAVGSGAPVSPPARRLPSGIVLRLALLFSLDSAGSGFVPTSLLVLWLHLRFDLGRGETALVFFAAGLLGTSSQFLAPILARRIGLVRTMVVTHLPANGLLALAALAPNGAVAVALLLSRALFAQMDVPARQAFVMAVVPPQDRAMAASVTNVPRSLASATTPLLAGALLSATTFGWPLLIAGSLKAGYDVLLLALHRNTPEAVTERDGTEEGNGPERLRS